MNAIERLIRARVIQTVRDTSAAPSVAELAVALGLDASTVREAMNALADEHLLVLRPGTHDVWMASPFSAIPSDFIVRRGDRQWFANCVWDGLSVLALLGDGTLETHSPASGEALTYEVRDGRVRGEGIVHFLVPARRFWDEIGFT